MKFVKTTEIEVGQYVALVMDSPNIAMELWHQGTVESAESCDMWGRASKTHTTFYIKLNSVKSWDQHVTVTVHNTHNWLVREER